VIAFGKVVRQLRKERKLSQEQLGFEADLQRIYVSKLELGQQQSLNWQLGYNVQLVNLFSKRKR
jgi:DNA-binding helix-turn-helix protein